MSTSNNLGKRGRKTTGGGAVDTPEAANGSNGGAAAAAAAAVQAYAKVEGPDFCYFVRKLDVLMGRKVAPDDAVDIHLGTAKSISRQHAKIQFNFALQCFEILVIGKNGLVLDGQYIPANSHPVPLNHKSKITIGDVEAYFLLPKTDLEDNPDAEDDNAEADDSKTKPTAKKRKTKSSPAEKEKPTVAESPAEPEDPASLVRPNVSYATMISQAILSTGEEKRMTLHEIYEWVCANYPYYKMSNTGWQNSIRHNLSLNRAFSKVARDEPGKGGWWTLSADYENLPATRRKHSDGGGGAPLPTGYNNGMGFGV